MCPPNVYLQVGVICRPAAGECDIAEGCGGLPGQACGPDAKKASGSLCTDDGNPCTSDTCNGTSDFCQHAPGNAGTVCRDRKSTRLNSSHLVISYAVLCLKK